MKAIIVKEFGGIENLLLTDIETPAIADNEVLIQTRAISLNPVDVKTRAGKGLSGRLKDFSPLIIGWDVSGTVVKTGSAVTDFKTGDDVFGMVNFPGHGKAYAEYVAAPADQLALKPANISHEEAAAATLAALTAWQALVTHAHVQPGQKVLVQAAGGGVGHYTVQIAKYLGAYVVGTSSAANKDFVLSLGADAHIDYHNESLDAQGNDYDFVLELVGGDNTDRSIELVKKGGTLISIPSGLSDSIKEKAAAKGINGYFFLVASNGKDMQSIAELLAKGIIRSQVSKTFPFAQMGQAHLAVETGKTKGKVIVTLID
jgi:NADPH:quinone reductase-like Zn-dependent oxidoreductase